VEWKGIERKKNGRRRNGREKGRENRIRGGRFVSLAFRGHRRPCMGEERMGGRMELGGGRFVSLAFKGHRRPCTDLRGSLLALPQLCYDYAHMFVNILLPNQHWKHGTVEPNGGGVLIINDDFYYLRSITITSHIMFDEFCDF